MNDTEVPPEAEQPAHKEQVLGQLSAARPRWLFSVAVQYALGGLMLYIAFATPPASVFWRAFLIVMGIIVLVVAERSRRSWGIWLELTEHVLRDSRGNVLARLDEIRSVDRGALAFKPSNGFLLRMQKPVSRLWVPGLYWRIGRSVGVGGVTRAGEGRFLAELIDGMVKTRNPDP